MMQMNAKLLGRVSFDASEMISDLEAIKSKGLTTAYREYSAGNWGTTMLWNRSGREDDSHSSEYRGAARPTEFASRLTAIDAIIRQHFKLDNIKSIRIFRSYDAGAIFPHIDYLEFKKGFKRIHLVLSSDRSCLNSEGGQIYHMRPGEIWFVDGRSIHSALSLSKSGKYSLVIDFHPDVEFDEIYAKNHGVDFSCLFPDMINDRIALPVTIREAFLKIAYASDVYDVKFLLFMATRFHFRYKLSGNEYFALLDEAFLNGSTRAVKERYLAYKNILIQDGHVPESLARLDGSRFEMR